MQADTPAEVEVGPSVVLATALCLMQAWALVTSLPLSRSLWQGGWSGLVTWVPVEPRCGAQSCRNQVG